MNKRPLSVTLISWLFIATGAGGFAVHLSQFNVHGPFDYGTVLICLISLLALLAGAFMLRAANWARWLLIAWIAFHVILSAFHAVGELIVHVVLFAVVTFFLFRPNASAYFRRANY